MKSTEKLYEAFGELIYVVAMADGAISKEELAVIEQKLAKHPWGADIKWSFDYEVQKHPPLEDLYKKLITYCEMHGPAKEYDFLLELVNDVAKATDGIDQEEQKVMDSFVQNLRQKFREDIDRINQ